MKTQLHLSSKFAILILLYFLFINQQLFSQQFQIDSIVVLEEKACDNLHRLRSSAKYNSNVFYWQLFKNDVLVEIDFKGTKNKSFNLIKSSFGTGIYNIEVIYEKMNNGNGNPNIWRREISNKINLEICQIQPPIFDNIALIEEKVCNLGIHRLKASAKYNAVGNYDWQLYKDGIVVERDITINGNGNNKKIFDISAVEFGSGNYHIEVWYKRVNKGKPVRRREFSDTIIVDKFCNTFASDLDLQIIGLTELCPNQTVTLVANTTKVGTGIFWWFLFKNGIVVKSYPIFWCV